MQLSYSLGTLQNIPNLLNRTRPKSENLNILPSFRNSRQMLLPGQEARNTFFAVVAHAGRDVHIDAGFERLGKGKAVNFVE